MSDTQAGVMKQKVHRKDLHTSKTARARTRRRYRSQNLLKIAGILAISLAAFALVSLLWSVISRAVLAFNETYITLDVKLDEKIIDPEGKRDPDTLYSASYNQLIRKALKEKFPGLGRSDKRKLYKIIGDVAAYELRDRVVATPSMIGKSLSIDLLADDDVDLYSKGQLGRVSILDADGVAHPVGSANLGSDIDIYVQSNSLNAGLNMVKDALLDQALGIERQARDQQRAANTMAARAKLATSDDKRNKALAQKKRYEDQFRYLTGKVTDLRRRARASGGSEELNPTLPSMFLKLNDGMVEVTRVEPDHIKGKVVRPLSSMRDAKGGEWAFKVVAVPEDDRRIKDNQIVWLEHLKSEGRIKQTFNWHFFTKADASEPEEAGILGGLLGTFWTMLVTFFLSFPIGVMAALYLEEFAPKNRITHFIEVNINNLAAVPSIVFGLLGLAVFVNFFGLPYSSSLVGGMVLALMTLPTVIIASRAAIKAVPPSIKEAALGIGASKMQTVFHHVLPLAMPGIMTGSIIGMAQALGETAPLLMIGMVAFIVDPPTAVTDAASSLPVLVYLWADRAEVAFDMRTAAAILTLLTFLVIMNGLAILLRKRFERRW